MSRYDDGCLRHCACLCRPAIGRCLRLGSVNRGALLGVIGLTLLLAGCSHDKKAANTQPAPVGDLSAVANNVTITMSARTMNAPEIISSGWTNFIISNGDTVAHTFAIQGNGVNRILPNPVQPGRTQQLRIRLRPGTYRIYCPTCGSDMTGMTRRIVVAQW